MTEFPDFDPSKIPQSGDQHDPKVRANQKAFQERFGDFKARHVTGIHLGPAPKGEWVGCIFDMEVLAMMSAGEIIQAAYGEAGKA
ncbi:hypothetical protein LB516_23995 [Mesorhizobium sp. CO1-1-7]|uniref:hypothetical protein n=1 Tax=Mesorhizobium sp. CO1-1-7 TaxID=2876632 RepID=UPI001CD11B86|nr:hypothetical protein [Mesorhizobium sp. CO1-1-7]MBZ9748297.1 hypothetical protein [Mesorhizobium sp. CO1-1-7]